MDATAFIGGKVVCGVIASAWQKYLVPPTDAGYRNAVSGIREVAKEARGKGVTIAVEVVNRFESNLFNTAAQAIRFVDAVGEDNVGIHLDTFHMHIEEPDAAAAIRACGPRLRYFHVNENHRGYLDAGSIDFAPVFRALVTAKYGGVIAFEAFSSSTCSPSVAGKAAVWRNVFDDSEDVARRAWITSRRAWRAPTVRSRWRTPPKDVASKRDFTATRGAPTRATRARPRR